MSLLHPPSCSSSNYNISANFSSGNIWSYEPPATWPGYHDFGINLCCSNSGNSFCVRWGFLQDPAPAPGLRPAAQAQVSLTVTQALARLSTLCPAGTS